MIREKYFVSSPLLKTAPPLHSYTTTCCYMQPTKGDKKVILNFFDFFFYFSSVCLGLPLHGVKLLSLWLFSTWILIADVVLSIFWQNFFVIFFLFSSSEMAKESSGDNFSLYNSRFVSALTEGIPKKWMWISEWVDKRQKFTKIWICAVGWLNYERKKFKLR